MVNNNLETEPIPIFPITQISECCDAESLVDTDENIGFCKACEMWSPYYNIKEDGCNG